MDDESYPGVKGHAFRYQDYYIFCSLHTQLSRLWCIGTRFHSMSVVVADSAKRTKVTSSIRPTLGIMPYSANEREKNTFVPENASQEQVKLTLSNNGKRNFRSINVLDKEKLDELKMRFDIRRDDLGNWEE